MAKDFLDEIKSIIHTFQTSMKQQLPALEAETNALIKQKVTDKNTIEYSLDTLLSLTQVGVGEHLFIKLLDYYKTIDEEGAAFYWKEFDNDDEE